jgi:hypothetical protein
VRWPTHADRKPDLARCTDASFSKIGARFDAILADFARLEDLEDRKPPRSSLPSRGRSDPILSHAE